MLTDSEREWVRENKTRNGCIYARRCRYTCFEPPHCPVIPTKEDLIDALEFSERVAMKLAKYAAILSSDIGCDDCPGYKACTRFENRNISCEDVFLKAAHLAIEGETDAD